MGFCYCVSLICIFIIFFAMFGYPLMLKILDKLLKPTANKKDEYYEPSVSYMIVAHNEERVIKEKLENAIQLLYPKEKFQIIVASDNSTDKTNELVESFIAEHLEYNICLYKAKERKGKTNAQNEAQKHATGEILVMTDANSIVKPNAIKELVSYFSNEDISYVCGKLVYSNADSNTTGNSEATYWNLDLYMRDVESRIQTITAGNGALYACRNSEYIDFEPIQCHDSAMPYAYARRGKRAIFNPNAIAIEKAGESNEDEFKRKVRMNRSILSFMTQGIKVLNIRKYKWFSIFYFGHRLCRYSLWVAHLLLLLSSILLAIMGSPIGVISTGLHIIILIIAALAVKYNMKSTLVRLIGYYAMTVVAQMVGVYNILTGKAKPFWEAAESTR